MPVDTLSTRSSSQPSASTTAIRSARISPTLRLSFRAFQQEFNLHLQPNQDLLHPDGPQSSTMVTTKPLARTMSARSRPYTPATCLHTTVWSYILRIPSDAWRRTVPVLLETSTKTVTWVLSAEHPSCCTMTAPYRECRCLKKLRLVRQRASH